MLKEDKLGCVVSRECFLNLLTYLFAEMKIILQKLAIFDELRLL